MISEGSKTISSIVGFSGRSTILLRRRRIGLHGGLLAGDAGDDGVAGVGGGLLAHDDVVTVEDAGVDHRLAAHPQHEELAVAGEVLGRGSVSSTFSAASTPVPAATSPTRGTWRTGRRSTACAGPDVVADLDGARLGGVAA